MKICLVINPNAGKKQGLVVAQNVTAQLTEAGIDVETRISQEPGATRRLAEELNPDDWDGVLAVGGDGTLFEVINGLLANREDLPIPVGQVPVGTGNSFLKDLGIQTPEDAIAKVLARSTRRVDVGHFSCDEGSYYFVNLLGAGFVTNVAKRAVAFKALGSLSYILGVVLEVIRLETTPMVVEIDGQVIEREGLFVEICNSRFTGGDMMMAPSASIDDGLLDVVVVRRVKRGTVLKLLPKIFEGKHVESPAVEVFQAKSVTLRSDRPMALTPDGETFGNTPIEVKLLPGKLEMFG